VAGEKFRRHSRAPQEIGKKAFVIFNPAGTGGQINEKDPALHGCHLLLPVHGQSWQSLHSGSIARIAHNECRE
jgi:hypothetical protein